MFIEIYSSTYKLKNRYYKANNDHPNSQNNSDKHMTQHRIWKNSKLKKVWQPNGASKINTRDSERCQELGAIGRSQIYQNGNLMRRS
jgi:hypothetical protein